MRRALRWIGFVALLLLSAAGGLYALAEKNSPIVDGAELGPGVETVKDGIVSVFLVDAGDGKVVLVDAGNDPSGAPILAALARRGQTKDDVVAILLTHGHDDHTAACNQFPSAAIYALENETMGHGVVATHPLGGAAAFAIGELRIEAFAVPGHTPGSAMYLARGVLFFGDSAGASADGKLRLFSGDQTQNVASLRDVAARLAPRAAEVEMLAFAHTGSLTGLQPLTTFVADTPTEP